MMIMMLTGERFEGAENGRCGASGLSKRSISNQRIIFRQAVRLLPVRGSLCQSQLGCIATFDLVSHDNRSDLEDISG